MGPTQVKLFCASPDGTDNGEVVKLNLFVWKIEILQFDIKYICKYMVKYQYDSYVLVSNTKATFTMSNYGVYFKTRIFLESKFSYPQSWYQDVKTLKDLIFSRWLDIIILFFKGDFHSGQFWRMERGTQMQSKRLWWWWWCDDGGGDDGDNGGEEDVMVI